MAGRAIRVKTGAG